MAFEVDPEHWDKTYAYLHAREQQNGVYRETLRRVTLDDGRHVDALVYLADPRHKQYAGRLSHVEQLKLVQQGQGQAGPNIEYVVNTHAHLVELGIQDPGLDALVNALQTS
jgi:cation transport protein ChaC